MNNQFTRAHDYNPKIPSRLTNHHKRAICERKGDMVENLFFSTLNGQRERVCESRAQSKSMWGMISNFNHNWLFIFPSERERKRERNSKIIHVRKRKRNEDRNEISYSNVIIS